MISVSEARGQISQNDAAICATYEKAIDRAILDTWDGGTGTVEVEIKAGVPMRVIRTLQQEYSVSGGWSVSLGDDRDGALLFQLSALKT